MRGFGWYVLMVFAWLAILPAMWALNLLEAAGAMLATPIRVWNKLDAARRDSMREEGARRVLVSLERAVAKKRQEGLN